MSNLGTKIFEIGVKIKRVGFFGPPKKIELTPKKNTFYPKIFTPKIDAFYPQINSIYPLIKILFIPNKI